MEKLDKVIFSAIIKSPAPFLKEKLRICIDVVPRRKHSEKKAMRTRSVYGSRAGLHAGNMKRTEQIYVWINCSAVTDAAGTNAFACIETSSYRSWDTVAKAKRLGCSIVR